MYTLYSALPAFGTRSASPFSTKAESLLRLTDLPYTRLNVNPTTGPRKKLPYLRCPDGRIVADSHNIFLTLQDEGGLKLESPHEQHPLRRTIEEHLYFVQMFYRWTHHRAEVRDGLFAEIPRPFRDLVFTLVSRQVTRALWGQGLGRLPEKEILQRTSDDLDAWERLLGESPFLGGDSINYVDVCGHGFLAQVIPSQLDNALSEAVRARPRLLSYYHRLDAELYASELDANKNPDRRSA